MESITSSLQESANSFSFAMASVVFIAYFVIDAMYAHYTLMVTALRPSVAATTGALMHFLLAFGVLSYVQNYLYILPVALGSWCGTYVVVMMRKKTKVLETLG